jgi:hypothetical protein
VDWIELSVWLLRFEETSTQSHGFVYVLSRKRDGVSCVSPSLRVCKKLSISKEGKKEREKKNDAPGDLVSYEMRCFSLVVLQICINCLFVWFVRHMRQMREEDLLTRRRPTDYLTDRART